MISYKVVDKSTRSNMTGSFGRLMENAASVLQEQENVSILNKKTFMDDVLLDEANWQTYKDALLEGCDESDRADIEAIFESTRLANIEGNLSIFGEAATDLDVFTTFTFPLIRNIWPRTSMKYSAITTVVKKPTFNISYIMPQIIKDGKVYDLNEITEGDKFKGFVYCPSLYDGSIKLENFQITQKVGDSQVQLQCTGAGTVDGFDLIGTVPGSIADRKDGASIDTNLFITELEVDGAAKGVKNLSIRPDLRGYFHYELSYMTDPIIGSGSEEAPETPSSLVKDTIMGRVDFAEGRIWMNSLGGKVKAFKLRGRLSPEFNVNTQSITYATRNDE